MARVVFFLVVGSVLTFVAILKSPMKTIIMSELQSEVQTASSEPAKELPSRKVSKPPQKTDAVRKTAENVPSVLQRTEIVFVPSAPAPASNNTQNDSLTRVLSDSAAIYSFNSSTSTVVTHLKKGDVVNPNLEVIDAGGRWTLVTVADQHTFGFVRSEYLGRQRPARGANPQVALRARP
jgi:hypothetical protein